MHAAMVAIDARENIRLRQMFTMPCFTEYKILLNISYDECILKDKILHSNLPAKWCKYYTVREDDEKNEVSTNK